MESKRDSEIITESIKSCKMKNEGGLSFTVIAGYCTIALCRSTEDLSIEISNVSGGISVGFGRGSRKQVFKTQSRDMRCLVGRG